MTIFKKMASLLVLGSIVASPMAMADARDHRNLNYEAIHRQIERQNHERHQQWHNNDQRPYAQHVTYQGKYAPRGASRYAKDSDHRLPPGIQKNMYRHQGWAKR